MTTSLGSQCVVESIPSSALLLEHRLLKDRGFSEDVIKRLDQARADSTTKHYRSKWTNFVAWAEKTGKKPLNMTLPLLAKFWNICLRLGRCLCELLPIIGLLLSFIGSPRQAMRFQKMIWCLRVFFGVLGRTSLPQKTHSLVGHSSSVVIHSIGTV